MGAAFAHELLHETQAIEAAGGLFLERENRRRTIGGVFFYLSRKRMTKPQRGKVFAYLMTVQLPLVMAEGSSVVGALGR